MSSLPPGAALAAQGREVYASACASCHGGQLQGGGGPPLSGPGFAKRWFGGDGTGIADLTAAIHRMPKQAPGSLTPAQYADVRAFLLQANYHRASSAAVRKGSRVRGPARPRDSARLPAAPARVQASTTFTPTDADFLAQKDGDWLTYNRDYKGSRYSPLAQITTANAARLQPVCMLQLGTTGAFMSSPIFYDGIGYVTTAYEVQAFDGATCERKWRYIYTPVDPDPVPTNRGLALYDGKVFRGTTDGHLLALDAVTGKLLWNVRVADSGLGYSVGAAPIAYRGRIYVGLTGGDYGAAGHIYAFDARSGKLIWTFDSIPKGREGGAESWTKGADFGGGATWTTLTIDPAENLVYAPIGNPAPDFAGAARPGDNLYTNSVVALDADTGKLRWYVQQRPADVHDWDTAAAPALYELDGRRYMAVGSKDGFVYVYDRDTHALLGKTAVTTVENQDVSLSLDRQVHACPGWGGGIEWYGPAVDPGLKALYVGSDDWCGRYRLERSEGYKPGSPYLEGVVTMDDVQTQKGWLYALDATTGKPIWSYQASRPMIGGVTPTAGGVVFTGGTDGEFLAFDAKDGRILYRFNTGGSVGGGVSTYLAGDRQYVAVASGSHSMLPFGVGGAPTIVVFALPVANGRPERPDAHPSE